MDSLKAKIISKKAILGVIGLGYVGLPLAVENAKAGYKTIGFDVQDEKVNKVNKGENYIGDIVNKDLKIVVESGFLHATSDFSKVAEVDCICICVPTPLDRYQQPDVSYIKASVENIVPYMHKEMLIVLESTTYPGTTEELVKSTLEKSGMRCGKDFYLAFSPERVDPGNLKYKTQNTLKVVGGITEKCTDVAATLYENILKASIYRVSSPSVAEMEKILENTYRNINIGLVNEMAMLCEKMNINFWEVIDAAKTKPYGFQAFYPCAGIGGHCIPLDPYYLSWKAREYGFHTSMIESSMIINDRMPEYTVERASKLLNKNQISLKQANILILGVAYKADIDDFRESPAIKVIERLKNQGANVYFFDPYIKKVNFNRSVLEGEAELSIDLLRKSDLVIIITNHSNIDYDFVQEYSKAIFDTKNAMKNVINRDNIELL